MLRLPVRGLRGICIDGFGWQQAREAYAASASEIERGKYEVMVGRGAWRALRHLKGYTSAFVLTEPDCGRHGARSSRRDTGWARLRPILVPSGESSKSLAMAGHVAAELLERGADRRSLLVALGGGVVGDLGGFVASTYMRGIDYAQAPTTVLAQVDSAIGGKTAVNIRAMKNLVGTFYAPSRCGLRPRSAGSLAPRAFRSGLYEAVKHSILSGPALFNWLERKWRSLNPAIPRVLGNAGGARRGGQS